MNSASSFFNNWSMWADAITVSVVSAAALSYLGVWSSLKKIVYVPLALSQASSLGVICSFFLAERLGDKLGGESALLNPFLFSLLFAFAASAYFARSKKDEAAATAAVYLFSAAFVLLLGGFVRKDIHDVNGVLFGNAVLVDKSDLYFTLVATAMTALTHIIIYKRLLYASFDEQGASASRVPYFMTQMIFYATLAVTVSVATKAVGALPAFGFTVFPAMTGLAMGRRMAATFIIAIIAGVISAFSGFYISFVYELPTGACMAAVSGTLYLVVRIVNSFTTRK